MPPSKVRSSEKSSGLSRSNRIRKKADFARLRKGSKKLVSRHWVLFYSGNQSEVARLAITITRRYGNAVARNRLRRLLREMFRLNKTKFSGLDLHFIAKQKPGQLEFSRYKEELHEDFQRLVDRLN